MLQAGKLRVQVPVKSLNSFNLPNASGRTIALRFTQPLTAISIRRYLEGAREVKAVSARKADSLTDIYDPTL
jgi:hypothetical protein